MGIFDSIKSAFSGKEDSEPDVSAGPSQMLRDAGIDPDGLEFGFGTGSITVSGEISGESDRQKILDVLSGAPGITAVEDNMEVAATEPLETPAGDTDAETGSPELEAAELRDPEPGPPAGETGEARTYTVQSGDTLWKIAESMYGNGSSYMKIFEANTGLLEDPDRIFPGQELVIPDPDD